MFRFFCTKFHGIKETRCQNLLCRRRSPFNSRGITRSSTVYRKDEDVGASHMLLAEHIDFPRLSRQQVTSVISYHAASFDVNRGVVKGFETNKLSSNNPIEDRSSQAQLQIPNVTGNQFLFGMYDGHGGCACAQIVSERLLSYISVMLSPLETLDGIRKGSIDPCNDLIKSFQQKDFYRSAGMSQMYRHSLTRLANEILSTHEEDSSVSELLQGAFTRLDQDILNDALPAEMNGSLNVEALSLALTGACACVALIDETDLYVANTGDCQAVLGVHMDNNEWEAVELSNIHSAENDREVKRIIDQHSGEGGTVLRGGRLLGDLAPLRAFGDARYKWPEKVMRHILHSHSVDANMISVYGDNLIPSNYKTPPYLTAEPEVTHHALSPRDRFLILASDGLWEHLEPKQVVNLVGAHMDGKQVLLTDFTLPNPNMNLKEINELLKVRKGKLANKPTDGNVATHLLRMALGPEHARLSHSLTLPEAVVRNFRDDITITVVYFDTEYIRNKAFAQMGAWQLLA